MKKYTLNDISNEDFINTIQDGIRSLGFSEINMVKLLTILNELAEGQGTVKGDSFSGLCATINCSHSNCVYVEGLGHTKDGSNWYKDDCSKCSPKEPASWEERFDEQFLSKDKFSSKGQFNEEVSGRLPTLFKAFISQEKAASRKEGLEAAKEEGQQSVWGLEFRTLGKIAGHIKVMDEFRDFFAWLNGSEGRFPERKESDGAYWWRKEARKRYEEAITRLEKNQ